MSQRRSGMPRTEVLAQAWPVTARSVEWRTPGAAALVAAALIIQHRITEPGADASSFTLRAQLIAALAAVAAAAILPDPAETLLDSSPTARAWRVGVRLSMALVAWTLTWAMTLALIASAPGPLPEGGLTRQALVLLAVAIGAGALRGPGAAGTAVAVVALGSLLLPDRWTIIGEEAGASWRLSLLALAGLVALGCATRDHARRHRTLEVGTDWGFPSRRSQVPSRH